MPPSKCLTTIALLILVSLNLSCIGMLGRKAGPSDEDLAKLDPKGIVRLYWESALRNDTQTIQRMAGPPGDSMLWDCPPKPTGLTTGSFPHGSSLSDEDTFPPNSRPGTKGDLASMLVRARVIEIAKKGLDTHYDLRESKTFGSEARLIYRPKESPASHNTLVFFLLHDGQQWRIVDLTDEALLTFVGNKKFGEPRECSSSE